MGDYFWFYSTVAQVFAALWAVTGMFAVFRLELLDRKIKDTLRSLLNFMLVRFKSNELNLIDVESVTKLNNIKEHVTREIRDNDEKEYFEWDVGLLLNRPPETNYIIGKYDNYVNRELERMEKKEKEKNKVTEEQEKDQALTKKIIREYRTRKNVYYTECNYKEDLINYLVAVTILDGSMAFISLLVLFYLNKPLPIKVNLASIQIFVLSFSLFAIILSAIFILKYCRRR